MWTMIAIAGRYGHQQISEVMAMDRERLDRFNTAVLRLVERENKSGSAHANRVAEGGG